MCIAIISSLIPFSPPTRHHSSKPFSVPRTRPWPTPAPSPIPILMPVRYQLHSGWNYSPTSSGSSRQFQPPDLLQPTTARHFPLQSQIFTKCHTLPAPKALFNPHRCREHWGTSRQVPLRQHDPPFSRPPLLGLLRPQSRHSLPPPLPPQLHLQLFGVAAIPHGATALPGAAERPLCVRRPPEGAAGPALPRLRGGRGSSSPLCKGEAWRHRLC